MLARDIRGGALLEPYESGNPVSFVEALDLASRITALLPPVPDWYCEMAQQGPLTIGSGGDGEGIVALVARAAALDPRLAEATVTLADVHAVIASWLYKTDAYFDAAGVHRKSLTAAILLATVMHHFGIQEVQFTQCLGNTVGMLIAPEFWQQQTVEVQ